MKKKSSLPPVNYRYPLRRVLPPPTSEPIGIDFAVYTLRRAQELALACGENELWRDLHLLSDDIRTADEEVARRTGDAQEWEEIARCEIQAHEAERLALWEGLQTAQRYHRLAETGYSVTGPAL